MALLCIIIMSYYEALLEFIKILTKNHFNISLGPKVPVYMKDREIQQGVGASELKFRR